MGVHYGTSGCQDASCKVSASSLRSSLFEHRTSLLFPPLPSPPFLSAAHGSIEGHAEHGGALNAHQLSRLVRWGGREGREGKGGSKGGSESGMITRWLRSTSELGWKLNGENTNVHCDVSYVSVFLHAEAVSELRSFPCLGFPPG